MNSTNVLSGKLLYKTLLYKLSTKYKYWKNSSTKISLMTEGESIK